MDPNLRETKRTRLSDSSMYSIYLDSISISIRSLSNFDLSGRSKTLTDGAKSRQSHSVTMMMNRAIVRDSRCSGCCGSRDGLQDFHSADDAKCLMLAIARNFPHRLIASTGNFLSSGSRESRRHEAGNRRMLAEWRSFNCDSVHTRSYLFSELRRRNI